MAEAYEGNGDFNYVDGSSDFKRKNTSSVKSDDNDDEHDVPVSEKVNEYLRELLSEKVAIDHKYPHAERLIDQEMTKVQQTGRIPHRDLRYVDIYREKQIRVTVKVLVPVKEHPKFNFVGKLLGPKGNSMKRLQEETMCKMAVLGRGSMKDRKKEEELRASLDPKYAHLNDDLHVEISALAPPAEAHARTAYALAEVRKYLIPDSNDCIRQEQMREMIADGTIPAESVEGEHAPYKGYHKPRVATSHPPRAAYPAYSYGPRVPAPGPPPRSPSGSGSVRTVMPAKQKILSILDRARNAMEESYGGYEEPPYEAPPPPHYEAYSSYGHPPTLPPPPPTRSSRYEVPEYETTEYRRDYYHREATSYPVKASSSASGGGRSSWKSSSGSGSANNYHHGSSRHDDGGNGGGHSKHAHAPLHGGHHSREHGSGRYRNSPYSRPNK